MPFYTPCSQQRLQDIIYRHSGLYPAAVARHHLPPPHATRIWNSSSCRRLRRPGRHGPDECSRPCVHGIVCASCVGENCDQIILIACGLTSEQINLSGRWSNRTRPALVKPHATSAGATSAGQTARDQRWCGRAQGTMRNPTPSSFFHPQEGTQRACTLAGEQTPQKWGTVGIAESKEECGRGWPMG